MNLELLFVCLEGNGKAPTSDAISPRERKLLKWHIAAYLVEMEIYGKPNAKALKIPKRSRSVHLYQPGCSQEILFSSVTGVLRATSF